MVLHITSRYKSKIITKVLFIALLFFLFYLFYELQNPLRRHLQTRILFNRAKKMSDTKHKKLMVIGDPCVGNVVMSIQKIFPNSGHGDVTIDLFGCNKCDKMDINNLNEWKKYKSNNYVIIETATLSFGKNLKKILSEIKRISGGDFFSAGGTTTLGWKYFSSKMYSKKYSNSLHHMIYPFDATKNKYYYYYDLRTNKNKKIAWNTL